MDKLELKTNFEKACNDYLAEFCERYEFDYDDAEMSWVLGDVGSVTCCGDYYVSMDNIRLCVDQDVKFDDFVQWYDYGLRIHALGDGLTTPNLYSWIKGSPRMSEDELTKMEERKAYINDLQTNFEKYIKESTF